MTAAMLLLFTACSAAGGANQNAEPAAQAASAAAAEDQQPAEKNGDIMILYTSDIHCGVDQGFGLVGLKQVRDTLEAQGYTTILVDDGDAVQGEVLGTVTKGEAMIKLMNDMKYDVVIPGNHEFNYGMEQFYKLVEMAEFPYISCNLTKEGELVFDPYFIKEAAGKRIAFVGVTTPSTLSSTKPSLFQNENGEYIYDFMNDESGEKLYAAVQKAVDDARAEGVDYVYLLGHLGNAESAHPWNYVDVISHTNGIDVLLDGHSHDTDQVTMKNKDGEAVVRSACGTKMECIGYSHISAADGIVDTNIWSWNNTKPLPELMGIQNEMSGPIAAMESEILTNLQTVIAKTNYPLYINDPEAKDASGNPIRIVRRAETNFGDLIADAIRAQTGADIGIFCGGGIRKGIEKGNISYVDIMNVMPFQNQIVIIQVTGQQLLDALEWSVKSVPEEFGGFLQVSGMTFEVDLSVPSGCRKDENGRMTGIEGERRVRNVMVGGEPIDPQSKYTIASNDFTLIGNGDGYTAFDGAEVVTNQFKLDSQLFADYLANDLGGVVGEEYAAPYGQERIKILE